ncbi:transposase [Nostocoides australiense]
MKGTSWSAGWGVPGDGRGVIAHAGSVAVRLLADRAGLTETPSRALARRGFVPGHDRGRVLVAIATMLVAGGEAIADIATLRHQEQVLGPVASPATVWRTLDELAETPAKRVAAARAKARARVWGLLPGGLPAARVADTRLPTNLVVLDVDATIMIAHSEKEQAARTFKKTFGYHPIGVWCDNTGELLAARLRPGNAGSNTAADHTQVLTEAIAQIPPAYRKSLLVRVDGAGYSHELLDWLTRLENIGPVAELRSPDQPRHSRRRLLPDEGQHTGQASGA